MFTLAARHQGSVCEKCLSLIQVTHIQNRTFLLEASYECLETYA